MCHKLLAMTRSPGIFSPAGGPSQLSPSRKDAPILPAAWVAIPWVHFSVLLGSPGLDTVASPGLSRGEWNDDLELLAAVLLTQPRDERWSARAEAEELCRASAAPHQRFPAPRCPQVRSGCCPAVGPSAALCGLQRPAAPVGPGSAIPLLSVLWWPDPEVPIGLPVPGEAADSLAVGPGGAALCHVPWQNNVELMGRCSFSLLQPPLGPVGRGILQGVWHKAQEGGCEPAEQGQLVLAAAQRWLQSLQKVCLHGTVWAASASEQRWMEHSSSSRASANCTCASWLQLSQWSCSEDGLASGCLSQSSQRPPALSLCCC
ncbi:uncharacterized protein LOC110408128 [Numida meleagris]|uniref:uncharacterized protein LOC110408128 n=1 Tax=Numida meleagris TaxID=8996 RepID=UPI000B3E3530|nr:uncharacterized protein LOC110408128 [Numida meleagris]